MAVAHFRCYTERSESGNVSMAGALMTGFLPASSWQWLCAISCFQSQALSFLLTAPSSTLFFYLLTLHLSTFRCTELFHILLLCPLAAAAFPFLSSHPPASCPILLQICILTLISLLIPSYTHFFVSCTYPRNVGPTLLFSCACLTGEWSLSGYVPGAWSHERSNKSQHVKKGR